MTSSPQSLQRMEWGWADEVADTWTLSQTITSARRMRGFYGTTDVLYIVSQSNQEKLQGRNGTCNLYEHIDFEEKRGK